MERGPDGSHRRARRGGPAQHQGRIETVPGPETAGRQVPRKWWFVESISSNGAGKPSRAQWRRDFLENRVKQGVAV